VIQLKQSINNHLSQSSQYIILANSFIKNSQRPINSLEHFVDIDYFIGNNNKTGVGNNLLKKTCGQKNNIVKNISLPGGSWL
jgi:hypothetical protein